MTIHHPGLVDIVRRDPRFPYEAYLFVFEALKHTQAMLNRLPAEEKAEAVEPLHHVSGPELLAGVRDLALRQFGLMARTVFHLWGIRRTDDFGDMVFNLIEANLMSKTDADTRADFHDIYDLDEALVKGFEIHLEEAE